MFWRWNKAREAVVEIKGEKSETWAGEIGWVQSMHGLLLCIRQLWMPQKPGCLKQEKLIFSQFWRMKVQDQSSSMGRFWCDYSYWLADSCLLAVSLHGRERALVSLPLLIRAPVLSDQGSTLNPNYLLKGTISNTIRGRLEFQHMNLWRGRWVHNSAHSICHGFLFQVWWEAIEEFCAREWHDQFMFWENRCASWIEDRRGETS